MELIHFLVTAVLVWQILLTILVILVGSHLSQRLNDHYADLDDTEETFRSMVSQVWKYAEAIDDAATGGAGNTLHLARMSRRKAQPRQRAQH